MRGVNPNPTVDFVFRKLFGSEENKDLLISLINSIVEPRLHLTDVIIKNPFNLAAYKGAKESIVDIKAMDQDGTWYDIEMQVLGHIFYGKRALFYLAKEYVDQLEAGEHYSALNTTIGIHFLGFDVFADDRMVRHFVFKDMDTNECPAHLEDLQLYFVELGKFHKKWSDISTLRDRWIAFLTQGQAFTRNNLPATLGSEAAIMKAVSELERMGVDPQLRDIYEAEEKAKMADIAELQYAEEQGIKRGIERGLEQGIEQGIERGLEQGIEQGILRGQRQMLIRQMTRHIGLLPAHIEARIDILSSHHITELGEALFDLNSYAEVDEWLSRL